MLIQKRSHKIIAVLVTLLIVLCVVAAIVYFVIASTETSKSPKGAVTTNGYECSAIGVSILAKGGSAVEAAIASLFCEGVAMPQSMGIGGGFFMTVYSKKSGKAEVLNCREVAPLKANETMYGGDDTLSSRGGLSIAVSGELRCYWDAYKRYGGTIPWRELIQPTIDLCINGILVTDYLTGVFRSKSDLLYSDVGLREAFFDPSTNTTWQTNQKMKRLRLAKTLEIIAEEGGDALNNGSLTENFAKDIQEANGIVTVEDLRNYKPEWQEPIKVEMTGGDVMYTTPLPGSGLILSFIFNLLSGFLDHSQPKSLKNWQRIVESFKFGYGKRTELGDTDFIDIEQLVDHLQSRSYADEIRTKISDTSTSQDPKYYGANTSQPDDHGTAHISILTKDGDAVSVTSTINLYFGSGIMSASTGIILNDEMDDFASPGVNNSFGIPPSIANYIAPKKRPLSSMCPTIIVGSNGDVKLVIGGAGGTKITTSVATTIIRKLWFDEPLEKAVNDKRLHHQLFPMTLTFEETYKNDSMDLVNGLQALGHKIEFASESGFSAITSVSNDSSGITAAFDKRRPGSKTYLY